MAYYETNRIEYKEKLTADLEEEAVAFLNSEGGDIFIGIRKDGSAAGVANTDDTQLKIADRLRDNIRPNILETAYPKSLKGMGETQSLLIALSFKQY